MKAPVIASGACLLLALGGCDSGEPEARRDEPEIVATKSQTELEAWLSPTDPMDTGRWLASREAGRLLSNDDEASARKRRNLGRAKAYFIEEPRMIANRVVQLGQMLADSGKAEPYDGLLEGLTAIAQSTNRKQLFGEMCQHYYNTREQGADRQATLARLAERYGAQAEGGARP